jgi:hypothetical protein
MQFSVIKIDAFDFPVVVRSIFFPSGSVVLKYTDAVLWDKTKQASNLKVLPNQLCLRFIICINLEIHFLVLIQCFK